MPRLFFALTLFVTTFSSAFAADGTLLVANRTGGSVSLIDVSTKVEIARLPIGIAIPHEMAASPDGRWAITGEYGSNNAPGRHIVVIDVAAAAITSRIDLGPDSRPHSIAFLSDSQHVVVTIQDSDELVLVDIISGDVLRSYPTGGREGHMVKLSQDESQAYVANRGGVGTLSIIWLNEDRPPVVIPTGRGAEGISVSPDGREIWVGNQGDRTITIVNAQTLEVAATLAGPAANRIEFLPNGQAVMPGGANADNTIRYLNFYDAESRQLNRRVELPGGSSGTGVRLLAQDDVLFLSDSARNEITVLDPTSGNSPELISINAANVDGMAWSPLRMNILKE
jgi:DNA-binding beta-propeller fold protein YncE